MKETILNCIDDLFMEFLYYARKEDEELGVGAIERAVKDGIITKQEIIEKFMENINDNFQ